MSIPGMIYPTQKGMPAGNPRDSAMVNMNNNAQNQANANAAMAGGKLKKRRKYRGGNVQTNSSPQSITVPQYTMPYEPQGGNGTNPNNQIQQNAAISTQGFANSALDGAAFTKGGTRRTRRTIRTRRRKGGNPDWTWGCSSGGRKRRTKKAKKSRSRKY
jgi:hypothetical protein